MNITQGYNEWQIILDKQKQIKMLKRQLREVQAVVERLTIKINRAEKFRRYRLRLKKDHLCQGGQVCQQGHKQNPCE